MLGTDHAAIYAPFARRNGITHKVVYARPGLRAHEAAFYIQNVNIYRSRLKGWMVHFHGVATTYLVNYLGWRRMLERNIKRIQPEFFCRRRWPPHATVNGYIANKASPVYRFYMS